MFQKEKESTQKEIDSLIEKKNNLNKHLLGLEAIDKYLQISELENNQLKDLKQIQFDSPLNGKTVVVAFKLNNRDFQFKFFYRENLLVGRNIDDEIRLEFSQKFSQFIYNLLFEK